MILFPIQKVASSSLRDNTFDHIPFGTVFTDHMLVAQYRDKKWQGVSILPFAPISLSVGNSALHYGQAIFEGMKAFKNEQGKVFVFRPYENLDRMNNSATRMCMPHITEDIFIGGLKQLIDLDRNWIPTKKDCSLYIRPLLFATDEILRVRPSDTYMFVLMLSPSGPYFSHPMNILIEEKYTRAAPGGVGFAKNAGNYGGSLYPTMLANEKGYDQILWTDANEHVWLQEVGMMNVFFLIGNSLITPALTEGTILPGVTRNTILTLAKDVFKLKVEERPIHVNEIIQAYKEGTLKEVFGAGTAAVISYIEKLTYKDTTLKFNVDKLEIAPKLFDLITKIRYNDIPNTYNWVLEI